MVKINETYLYEETEFTLINLTTKREELGLLPHAVGGGAPFCFEWSFRITSIFVHVH